MKNAITRVLLGALLALPAFAGTPDQPKEFSGPFTDAHMRSDEYRIGMQGAEFEDQAPVEYDCLVWAAELTVQSGRRYFVIYSESYVLGNTASKPMIYVAIQTLPDGGTYSLAPMPRMQRASTSFAKGTPRLLLQDGPHLIDSLKFLRGAQKKGIRLEPKTIATMKSV